MFARPVDEAEVPGYRSVVAKPIDLGTILRRIRGAKYSLADMNRDVTLLVDNCLLFNGTDGFYAQVQSQTTHDRFIC